ncbi:MAG: hypothetical protein ACOYM0_11460 [Bacteroidales bacterium]
MKKNLLFLFTLVFCTVFLSSSCKKNSTSAPCNGVGTICFENKRDSLLIITITQIHTTIPLLHDQMQCQNLAGGATYTVKFSGPAYTGNLRDTTMLIQNCDNKLYIILPAKK